MGDVDVALTATNSGSNFAFDSSNVLVSKDADTNTIIVASIFNQAADPGATATVTSTASDPTASDNGQANCVSTTTVLLKGVIGTVTATAGGNAAGATVAAGTASTACASSVTAGAIGTFGANGAAATTFKWSVSSVDGDASKLTFADDTLATTTFAVAADAPAGTYTLTVEYDNEDAEPAYVTDDVVVTVTAS